MSEFVDKIAACPYCGDVMEYPTEEQIKIFGEPICCGFGMLAIEREKIHGVVRSMDILKKNLETELLKGTFDF
jgi:hypothetical protein